MSPVVDRAHPTDPRFNQAFAEYAQDRGFVIDPARVRRPADKPRVERMVPFVRGSFFAGEQFTGLADAQRKAEAWCAGRAGQRIHRTTRCRPAELFALEEAPRLLPAPVFPYDLPLYASPKVHRDHHIEVARALYSVPGHLIGKHVEVRADRQLVRACHRGALVKVHPRARPGGRVTDPADLPADKTAHAMRDLGYLQRLADDAGPAIGAYAAALLDHPLPWTRMRQVYALLGLVRKWGPRRVDTACARALEAEAISVPLIGRMLQRATEDQDLPHTPPLPFPGAPPRFARDASYCMTSTKHDVGVPRTFVIDTVVRAGCSSADAQVVPSCAVNFRRSARWTKHQAATTRLRKSRSRAAKSPSRSAGATSSGKDDQSHSTGPRQAASKSISSQRLTVPSVQVMAAIAGRLSAAR